MADSIRKRVLIRLQESLEAITPENGFEFDLSGAVFRGRMVLDANDPLPAVVINEKPVFPEELFTDEAGFEQITKLDLLVQGFVAEEPRNPTDKAYDLLADVRKRLAQVKTQTDGSPFPGHDILGFGPVISKMQIGQGIVRSPDSVVSGGAYFYLPVILEMGEDMLNPVA